VILSTISRIGLVLVTVVFAACGGASEEAPAPQPQQPASQPLQSEVATPDASTATGSGRITGLVFEDQNRNGTFDASDARMAKQTVVLTNPSATQQVQSATTGDDGTFRLESVAAGEYRISLQIPEGYERTNDDSFGITIGAGVTPSEVRFGVVRR
jgi:hypothetical protein